jgi:hypothetical protein
VCHAGESANHAEVTTYVRVFHHLIVWGALVAHLAPLVEALLCDLGVMCVPLQKPVPDTMRYLENEERRKL